LRHRPIGLGVQGLADAFIMLLAFTGDEAKKLNQEILKHYILP
jgi:ribonucleoside-diphosphate reductase alpha chain